MRVPGSFKNRINPLIPVTEMNLSLETVMTKDLDSFEEMFGDKDFHIWRKHLIGYEPFSNQFSNEDDTALPLMQGMKPSSCYPRRDTWAKNQELQHSNYDGNDTIMLQYEHNCINNDNCML